MSLDQQYDVSCGPLVGDLTERLRDHAVDHVRRCCADQLAGRPEARVAAEALPGYVSGGKLLRSTFALVGWSCGRGGSDAAMRAVASLELLHCFALVQDDVMDGSPRRRGRPALHVTLSAWHREQGLSGSAERFGASAATLFGDLLLVWAEQMLRESGLDDADLARAWPLYDAMRAELVVGQLSDLVNDTRAEPTWESVLDVARRKSGNYTVRRPLEFGAALAGCDPSVTAPLSRYGALVGEAFQLRDDVLGVFGHPSTTGKPAGDDLRNRTATSLVVVARDRAGPAQRRAMRALAHLDHVDADAVAAWQDLICDTGAPERIEEIITARVDDALAAIGCADVPEHARDALTSLAHRCTDRRD
ncbi:geranylgeranyl diphosphate synthase type I [Pseudonocardia sediminis]|uniref:Geranylgeranyl diphosphate synthase type I n=1 Tax=Pseudonocardia sediminis TaxID=1397368 RepID=A0A4Q7UTC4_PSEST|nr:polyprenyl synthetase family protein [Pseudonocardia sediminis]RZT84946.1 geranylgeranyl diphosphate synthase type I [Pseudonocardia sediminis]